MLLHKVEKITRNKLIKKLLPNRRIYLSKYFRILKLNRRQLTYRSPNAGRGYSTKPSGTNKGQSRMPRTTVPGKGRVVIGKPGTRGGPRGYHDSTKKRILKLNKKERKLIIQQILLQTLLYTNTYYVNDIQLQDRKNIINVIRGLTTKYGEKVNRYYRSYKKSAIIIHNDPNIFRLYKNAAIETMNINTPYYLPLELNNNSNHIIIMSQLVYEKLVEKLLDETL